MSDLVGNPGDRFSHDTAHINHVQSSNLLSITFQIGDEKMYVISYEPCLEKTCLRNFQPGLTQTGLYSNRRFFFFFFFFLIQFNVPFKIISLIETSQSIGGRNGSTPGKPPDTPASRTCLVSHVASAGLKPTPDTAMR